MRITASALHPVKLVLLDEKEHSFRLTFADLDDLCDRFGVEGPDSLTATNPLKLAAPLFYKGLLDKGDLTEKQFAALLPVDVEWLNEAIPLVMGVKRSEPDPSQANPMK